MATFIIGDIHNTLTKLNEMIRLISPTMQDQVILLGDLFDRGGAEPDPVGVYFRILGRHLRVKCKIKLILHALSVIELQCKYYLEYPVSYISSSHIFLSTI